METKESDALAWVNKEKHNVENPDCLIISKEATEEDEKPIYILDMSKAITIKGG